MTVSSLCPPAIVSVFLFLLSLLPFQNNDTGTIVVGQIVRLQWINTTSGVPIIESLVDGTRINFLDDDDDVYSNNNNNNNKLQFIIEAVVDTTTGPIGSVRFVVIRRNTSTNSTSNTHIENVAPYTACVGVGGGDDTNNNDNNRNGNSEQHRCREFDIPGIYTITATPFSRSNAHGVIGSSYTVSLTVTSTKGASTPPTIAPTVFEKATPTIALTPVPAPIRPLAPAPIRAPTTSTTQSPATAVAAWVKVPTNDTFMTTRHEACFVMVGRRAYALGGRRLQSVSIYDPIHRVWYSGPRPPIIIHHAQCVVVNDCIYFVSAWTGNYPMEPNVDRIHIYNTTAYEWSTKPGLPEERLRGGAASIRAGNRIYVSHGNRGGHETANFSISLGYLDYYDLTDETWYTNLPDAPNPRDHTGGAYVNGRICVAGGRDGGDKEFFRKPILPTDCYDPVTNTWSTEADIPTGRAGASYGTTCDGKLMVAGGEGFGGPNGVFANVDVFDGTVWTTVDALNVARHGSALAVDCICDQIHIAGGAASRGTMNETKSVETYFRLGVDTPCLA